MLPLGTYLGRLSQNFILTNNEFKELPDAKTYEEYGNNRHPIGEYPFKLAVFETKHFIFLLKVTV